ncbi:MAG: tetratricopeptide repeat protein, partial [Chloroflexi bacterium]|nr:tetratricopeptide repeat protein [Chloroflexota bacterium]
MKTQCPVCEQSITFTPEQCPQCGTAMWIACPTCAAPSPVDACYCAQCGANLQDASTLDVGATRDQVLRKLESYIPEHLTASILHRAQGRIEGERRLVTVLFADVSGFTAIAERLGPEAVFRAMNDCLQVLVDAVYRYEGTVNKFIGDGLMALFGAPLVHENDPERAVCAALDMEAGLVEFNRRLVAQVGELLLVRVGIHTGEVIAGSMGTDQRMDYTVMGDTVNLAARLETSAQPGSILVSEDVYRQTRPLFDYQEPVSITVKGKAVPVQAYEVIGPRAKPGRVRGIEHLTGLFAPLIGRDAEMARLTRAANLLLREHRGQVVTLVGEAGLGKSRLTEELRTSLRDHVVAIWEGRCLPHATETPYAMVLDLLRNYMGLTEAAGRDQVRASLHARLSALPLPLQDTIGPYLYRLFSLEPPTLDWQQRLSYLSPVQIKQQTQLALRNLFEWEASQRPVLLIFEDIHWIDSLSLDLVLALVPAVEVAPLMLYGITRPGPERGCQAVIQAAQQRVPDRHVALTLQPLSLNHSHRLVEALLVIADLPESVKAIISTRSEGNPFFLEEVIRSLIEAGLLQRRGSYWQTATEQEIQAVQVPPTLTGIIAFRVDRLPASTRVVLQHAAVVGRRFSVPLLQAALDPELTVDLGEALNQLAALNLIESDGDGEYLFHHSLTQQVVYEGLLTGPRQAMHQRVGHALDQLYPDRQDELVEQLAYHFEQACRPEQALPYLIAAGEKGRQQYANAEALSFYQRALEQARLVPVVTVEQQLTIYVGMGHAYHWTGELASAIESLKLCLPLLTPDTAAHWIADIYGRIGRTYEKLGDYQAALGWLNDGIKHLEPDPLNKRAEERASLYAETAWSYLRRGQRTEAEQWARRGLTLVEGAVGSKAASSLYNVMGGIAYSQGDWDMAIDYTQRRLALWEQLGDLWTIASSHNNLAVIYGAQGDWNRAIEHHEQSLALAERIGEPYQLAASHNNLGYIYKERGQWDQALAAFQHSLSISQRIDDQWNVAQALVNLGDTYVRQGQVEQGLEYLERGLVVIGHIDARDLQSEAYRHIAEALLAQGQPVDAQRWAEQARDLACELENRAEEGCAWRVLGQCLLQLEQWAEAWQALDTALQTLEAINSQ